MIRLKDLENERAKSGDVEIYTSYFRYPTDDPNIGPVYGGFLLDFDDEINPDRARKEAFVVACYLRDALKIPEEFIDIRFSGHKGISVAVPAEVFGVKPSVLFPAIYKQMARDLARANNLKTLDLKIYERRRLWRLPNSKHGATGFFKIFLTTKELADLKMEEIKRMATAPRHLTRAVVPREIPEARAFYLAAKDAVENEFEGRKELTPTQFKFSRVPPCVEARFAKGSPQGSRNQHVFELAVYLARRGEPIEKARDAILEFARRCNPPLEKSEAMRALESAYRGVAEGKYSVGCSSDSLADLCPGKEKCFLFAEKAEKEFSPEVKATAEALLKAPDSLKRIKEILDLSIARDYKAKMLTWLLELSGKRPAGEKQIIVLKGRPASGKTHMADHTTCLFKTKERARFSEHALDYTELQGYDILYLSELFGMDENARIRLMSADDRGYTIEVTVKDPETGEFTTQEKTIPPMTIVSTTTALDIEEQFDRRAWSINADETDEQTKAVLEFKAQKEIERAEILFGVKKPDIGPEVLECAIEMLDPNVEIIVPCPRTLALAFDTRIIRVRGDYDKFLTLIKLVAFWHQRQRQVFEVNGRKIIFATLQDIHYAFEVGWDWLVQTMTGIEQRIQNAIPIVKQLCGVQASIDGQATFERRGAFEVKDFAKKAGLDNSYARRILRAMVDRGLLVGEKEGRKWTFEMEPGAEENYRAYSSLAPKPEYFYPDLKKEAKKVLKAFSDFWVPDDLFESVSSISLEMCKPDTSTGENNGSKSEMGQKETGLGEKPVSAVPLSTTNKTACSRCGARGKGLHWTRAGEPLCDKCAQDYPGDL